MFRLFSSCLLILAVVDALQFSGLQNRQAPEDGVPKPDLAFDECGQFLPVHVATFGPNTDIQDFYIPKEIPVPHNVFFGIKVRSEEELECSGIMISKCWILLPADCLLAVIDAGNKGVIYLNQDPPIDVTIGSYNIHPDVNLALVKMLDCVVFIDYVLLPPCMPWGNVGTIDFINKEIFAIGKTIDGAVKGIQIKFAIKVINCPSSSESSEEEMSERLCAEPLNEDAHLCTLVKGSVVGFHDALTKGTTTGIITSQSTECPFEFTPITTNNILDWIKVTAFSVSCDCA